MDTVPLTGQEQASKTYFAFIIFMIIAAAVALVGGAVFLFDKKTRPASGYVAMAGLTPYVILGGIYWMGIGK
jgi:hypothetical protein